jgi:hypothetical protein
VNRVGESDPARTQWKAGRVDQVYNLLSPLVETITLEYARCDLIRRDQSSILALIPQRNKPPVFLNFKNYNVLM